MSNDINDDDKIKHESTDSVTKVDPAKMDRGVHVSLAHDKVGPTATNERIKYSKAGTVMKTTPKYGHRHFEKQLDALSGPHARQYVQE